ncbi:MAG: phosphopantetheine-binding protein [Acetobacteraceae bacterium]
MIQQVAKEQAKQLVPLSDDVRLLETGLDSLCLAIIVARLEDELGADPFSATEDISVPTTIGHFVGLYENPTR